MNSISRYLLSATSIQNNLLIYDYPGKIFIAKWMKTFGRQGRVKNLGCQPISIFALETNFPR